jgi:hypothetical protein
MLNVVVYVGWVPARTSAVTSEDPAAQDVPSKKKTAFPSSSMVAGLGPNGAMASKNAPQRTGRSVGEK